MSERSPRVVSVKCPHCNHVQRIVKPIKLGYYQCAQCKKNVVVVGDE